MVCALRDVIEIFCPKILFKSVDLPTFVATYDSNKAAIGFVELFGHLMSSSFKICSAAACSALRRLDPFATKVRSI